MSTLAIGTGARSGETRRHRLLVAASYATALLSAALLFSVEPMFSKMVLPVLGGSASVWSIAMVVFQGLLLGGYVYSHFLTKRLSLRSAVLVHALLLVAGAFALPIAISSAFDSPPASGVSLWVAALFVVSIGAPCFALSASAPLLQAWFSASDHKDAGNPYFLYRASNIGSFAILIAYPTLLEPNFGLSVQSHLWSLGYVGLFAGIALCGALALRSARNESACVNAVAVAEQPITGWRECARWVVLALIPSGLLVAVTAHIATDVASAPFLWVVPLALYLLTFVLTFSDKPLLTERLLNAVQPAAVAIVAILLLWTNTLDWGVAFVGHLVAFLIAAMICHTRLYRCRPPATELTRFYVMVSVGGLLGGSFAALVAPYIFSSVVEYPLLVFASLLVRADISEPSWRIWRDNFMLLGAFASVLTLLVLLSSTPAAPFTMSVMVAAVWMAFQSRNPARLVGLAAIVLAAATFYDPAQTVAYEARSFYGVYKVVDLAGGRFRVLYHGTTSHGAEQRLNDAGIALAGNPAPLTYYYRGGPFGEAIQAARVRNGGRLVNVALVGLGVGALTCYAVPGENWSIFELDPLDVSIASNRGLFRTMSSCGQRDPIFLGDGRLTLKRTNSKFDLLLLDVYSSDSVPTHMLTREAFALFRSRLTAHGVIAINISNKHMDLASVVAASAAANGMVTAIKRDNAKVSTATTLRMNAEIALVARSPSDMAGLHLAPGWRRTSPRADVREWSDDYSDVFGAIVRKAGG